MTKQKERTIEEYIAIAKADIWVYVAVAIIILCVLLAICYFYEIPWYLAVLCDVLFFGIQSQPALQGLQYVCLQL